MPEQDSRPPAAAISIPQPVVLVLAGSAVALAAATGILLGRLVQRFRDGGARAGSTGESQRTIVYGENLPASLARREPLPAAAQPRYGGTGSLGVSPRAVDRALGHVERANSSRH